MAYPIIASYATGTTIADTHATIVPPTGTEAGDLVILFIAKDAYGAAFTTPTGWTTLANLWDGATDYASGIFYRQLTAPLTSFDIYHEGNQSTENTWTIVRIPNGDIPQISTVGGAVTNTNLDPPSLTHTFDAGTEVLWIAYAGWDGGKSFVSYPTNFPDNRYNSVVDLEVGMAIASLNSITNPQNPDPFVISASDGYLAYTVAVKLIAPPALISSNLTFTDDSSLLKSIDRGACIWGSGLREVSGITDLGGGSYRLTTFSNVGVHKVGAEIEWYRPANGFSVTRGKGTVTGWTDSKNVEFTLTEGLAPAAYTDYVKNYLGDTVTLAFFRLLWRDIEPTKGNYDFSSVSNSVHYQYAVAKGMKIVFRLMMDLPSTDNPATIDIPQWLYDEMSGAGTWYTEWGLNGFSPDYSSTILRGYHQPVLQAIANFFGNSNIFHAQMGSLGAWGELHRNMPNESIQQEYYQHYLNVFGSKCPMRRNMNFMRLNNLGVYFDMLGNPNHLGGPWNEWWGLLTEMEGYTDSDGITHLAYPEFRDGAPIGGELDPAYNGQAAVYDFSNDTTGRRYSEMLPMAEYLQQSYLYTLTPSLALQDLATLSFQDNLDDFMRKLGYRFCVNNFSYLLTPESLQFEIGINNNGMAKCHTSYPAVFKLYDNTNTLLETLTTNIDLTQIAAYSTETYTGTLNFTSSLSGITNIGIAIEGTELPLKSYEIEENTYSVVTDPIYSGAELTFDTLAAANISSESVDLKGEISSMGMNNSIDVHFEYREVATGTSGDFDTLTTDQEALVDYFYTNLTNSSHIYNDYISPLTVSTATADHVLTWQTDYNGRGGWGKNMDDVQYTRDWNGTEWKTPNLTQNNTVAMATIDNYATTSHMHYLAAVYTTYGGATYKASILKAMDMILYTGVDEMRHDYGEYNSWGQFYPPQTWEGSISENNPTTNDFQISELISMFQKILWNVYPFNNDIFDAAYKAEIQIAYDKVIEWLIRCQVKKANGMRTMWCGCYDLETGLIPSWQRNFEPDDLLMVDSNHLMLVFLSLPLTERTHNVKRMIFYGAKYMYDTVQRGWVYTHNVDPYYVYTGGAEDYMWYMFQYAETGEGVWAENYIKYDSIYSLSAERISGYYWSTERAFQYIQEYDDFVALYGEPEIGTTSGTTEPWLSTTPQTISSTGIITQNIVGLNPTTQYEFKIVVEAEPSVFTSGTILNFTTTSSNFDVSLVAVQENGKIRLTWTDL